MTMHKQAIIVTKENIPSIAETLIDYTAQDIRDEALLPINQGKTVILVKHVLDGGDVVSHIVLESMFFANMMSLAELNDKTFVDAVPRP